MRVVLVDANLLLLLVVGAADRRYIAAHRRLKGYGADDYDVVEKIVSDFEEIVTCPNVLTEVSNFALRIDEPARTAIRWAMRQFVEATTELIVPSRTGVARSEFLYLGLTDVVLLQAQMDYAAVDLTLLTADERLAAEASALGQAVINYPQFLRTGSLGYP